MKKARKILAVLLALCMAFALFACASNNTSGSSTPSSSAGSSTAPAIIAPPALTTAAQAHPRVQRNSASMIVIMIIRSTRHTG